MLTLAWAPWLIGVMTVLFLVVSTLMILTVLIQKPQGGGLAAAFGGSSGSGQTAFGTKTGDALTVFTVIVFVLFLVIAVVLNFAEKPRPRVLEEPVIQTTAPGVVPPGAGAVEPAPAQPAPALPATDGGVPATPAPATPASSPTPDPASKPTP